MAACVLIALTLAAGARPASAEDVSLDPDTIVTIPSPTLDDLEPLQDKDADSTDDPAGTVEDVIDGVADGDGEGGGSTGRGSSPTTRTPGEAARVSGANGDRASGGISRTGQTPALRGGRMPVPGVELAPPKAYTSLLGEAAVSTARRAVGLAGPAGPPLLLGLAAVAVLIALACGNDRLVRLERAARRRVYRL